MKQFCAVNVIGVALVFGAWIDRKLADRRKKDKEENRLKQSQASVKAHSIIPNKNIKPRFWNHQPGKKSFSPYIFAKFAQFFRFFFQFLHLAIR